MILLTGIPSEPPLHLVIKEAERAGIEYALFNQRESHFCDISLTIEDGKVNGILRVQEKDWKLRDFAGVYVRLMDYQQLPENQSKGYLSSTPNNIEKSFLLHETFLNWLEVTKCRVMNRGSDMASNMSKPYQAQLINRVGFSIPTTLITNNQQEVRHFLKTHKRVIYKSISSIRSIVKELGNVKIKELKNIRYLPTQFQAYVSGCNIRVHVVGDVLFATKIHSEAVDYRYASRENLQVNMTPITLPETIETMCFQLSHNLRLPLCGIDLKVTPDNEYYCFEVNPSPGYSYYQQNTGQNIAQAIVNYLEFGTAKHQNLQKQMLKEK